MRIYYDFHIHSCLSPCADNDMTPNNIVNMAKLNGLNAIALTDHNSCGNCKAVVDVGMKNDLLVIPGMELCTAEEIHAVCLFKDCNSAIEFSNYVFKSMLKVKNRPEIFGDQLLMNEFDEIIGEKTDLLLTASSIGINEAVYIVRSFGGILIPAHIDRDSYSVLSNLGFFPKDLYVSVVEYTKNADIEKLTSKNPILKSKKHIIDSDAHYLEDMKEKKEYIDIYDSDFIVNNRESCRKIIEIILSELMF